MTPSPIARADAAFQEQIHRQWQDWHAYLAAHLALLDAHDDGLPAFERGAAQADAAAAQRRLDHLPAPQRALFDAVRAERRTLIQHALEARGARLPDPDHSEQEALRSLLAEATGTAAGDDRRPDWGDVPVMVDGQPQWYQVHVPALRAAPDAAAYAVGADESDRLRARLAMAGLLVVGALVFLVVWFWPRATVPAAAPVALAHVNGTPLPAWPARQLDLISAAGQTTTVTLTATDALGWPAASNGAWRSDVVYPLTLCAPAAALTDARSARIAGSGDVPARRYSLTVTRGAAVDLVVAPCATADDTAMRFGTLQATELPVLQPFGQLVTLAVGQAITVTSITLVGPGDDPALPPDTARAVVMVAGPALDWPALAPTLRQADGSRIGAPEPHPTPGGVALHYLLPLPDSPRDLAWELTPPGQAAPLRWQAHVLAPPDRRSVVAQAIAVETLRVVPGDPATLAVVMRNRGDSPFTLTSGDLTLSRADAPLVLPPLPDLDTPLPPGASRTLAVPLPAHEPDAPLILQIGRARWTID